MSLRGARRQSNLDPPAHGSARLLRCARNDKPWGSDVTDRYRRRCARSHDDRQRPAAPIPAWRGLFRAEPAVSRPAGAAAEGDRAASSGVWWDAPAELVPWGFRYRLPLSRPARSGGTRRRDGRRLVVWRLDCARDGGTIVGADRAARADRLARGQVLRTRRAGHRRPSRAVGRRGRAARLRRPGACSRLRDDGPSRGRKNRLRPRGGGDLRLAAVHAQPGAAALAAPRIGGIL